MSILPQLERDLLDAAQRRLVVEHEAAAVFPVRRDERPRTGRLLLAFTILALLLASTTIALAATGVILSGSPVKPIRPPSPTVGEGVPSPGRSRLLPLRAPDPSGGLPWGIRIVHTTRGLVCLQIGRVYDGQLGELGVDGAFHDDGRFHPVSPSVLPLDANSGQSENASCRLAGQTFTSEVEGIDRNATTSENVPSPPREGLRNISYGELGAHAVSVTYNSNGTDVTQIVKPPVGAYLVVQRATAHQPTRTSGGSTGTGRLSGPRPNPYGALTTITYRFAGTTCQDSTTLKVTHPCPNLHRTPAPLHPAVPPNLHRPLHTRLQIHNRLITGAELSFTAPFAATSARQEYDIAMPSPCHLGTIENPIDRDVTRGSTVHISLSYPFANACGSTVPLQVLYEDRNRARVGLARAPIVVVGSTTLRIPHGDRPAPPPVR